MRSLSRLGVALALSLLLATPAAAIGTAIVSTGADAGPGSFRAAIEAANADATIGRIVFEPALDVVVTSDVVYAGTQPLAIEGNGSSVASAPGTVPAETWDGGLLVSTGGADLSIRKLAFLDSMNNGLAVFVPAGAEGEISLSLYGVTVDGARFHGVFFDGQVTTGFNTDDVIHPDCVDPHPVDAPASMRLSVVRSAITNNGTLAGGFETGTPFVDPETGETLLTGCPADFDGIRVDDGGDGGISGFVSRSLVEGNLADGIEFDDTGAGDVSIFVIGSRIEANGETGTDDLDDGLDLDEAGDGDLFAFVTRTTIRDNRDEGLDFDEAGEGNAVVLLRKVDASANEDEGFKVDEEDGGDLSVLVLRSTIEDSLSQDGVQLTEEGDGGFLASFLRTLVSGNDGDAIDGEQADAGAGLLLAVGSDFTGNANPSLDLDGVMPVLVGTLTY